MHFQTLKAISSHLLELLKCVTSAQWQLVNIHTHYQHNRISTLSTFAKRIPSSVSLLLLPTEFNLRHRISLRPPFVLIFAARRPLLSLKRFRILIVYRILIKLFSWATRLKHYCEADGFPSKVASSTLLITLLFLCENVTAFL